jgi:hypothetical protein
MSPNATIDVTSSCCSRFLIVSAAALVLLQPPEVMPEGEVPLSSVQAVPDAASQLGAEIH